MTRYDSEWLTPTLRRAIRTKAAELRGRFHGPDDLSETDLIEGMTLTAKRLAAEGRAEQEILDVISRENPGSVYQALMFY